VEVVINISIMCDEGIKEVMKNYLFGFLLELTRANKVLQKCCSLFGRFQDERKHGTFHIP